MLPQKAMVSPGGEPQAAPGWEGRALPVHPKIAELLQKRAALNLTPYHAGPPRQARQSFETAQAALPPNRGRPMHATTDHQVTVAGGAITIRLHQPKPEPSRGTILYFHGGGWVVGELYAFDPVCRELAAASGLEVANVGYRLAPEHSFPGPVEDAFTALHWLQARSPDRPIVIMGDSAGANLAAACAIKARDAGTPAIALQVLVYPVMDSNFTRPSYMKFGTGDYLLSTSDMKWF